MAVALLDVNVLVALFDPDHVHHQPAHEWFAANREGGWATCPLTENGFVRVLSNPAYSGRGTTVQDAAARLAVFCASGDHQFWPDTLTLREEGSFAFERVRGHRQITDAYLLALAAEQGGRLATFDQRIGLEAVVSATAANLACIGA